MSLATLPITLTVLPNKFTFTDFTEIEIADGSATALQECTRWGAWACVLSGLWGGEISDSATHSISHCVSLSLRTSHILSSCTSLIVFISLSPRVSLSSCISHTVYLSHCASLSLLPSVKLASYYVSLCLTLCFSLTACLAGCIIGFVTEYYTSHSYKPVREVAESCTSGAAPNIIYGLALGYLSTIIPITILSFSVFISFYLCAMYGVSLAALGMLGTLATRLSIDVYGPIADNAVWNTPLLALTLPLLTCNSQLFRRADWQRWPNSHTL